MGSTRRKHADPDAQNYVRRGNLLVELLRKHATLQAGDEVLELGTGWMHWYAVYVRLFFDLRMTTFDVWDNRQFAAFAASFSKLRRRFDKDPPRAATSLPSIARSGPGVSRTSTRSSTLRTSFNQTALSPRYWNQPSVRCSACTFWSTCAGKLYLSS